MDAVIDLEGHRCRIRGYNRISSWETGYQPNDRNDVNFEPALKRGTDLWVMEQDVDNNSCRSIGGAPFAAALRSLPRSNIVRLEACLGCAGGPKDSSSPHASSATADLVTMTCLCHFWRDLLIAMLATVVLKVWHGKLKGSILGC